MRLKMKFGWFFCVFFCKVTTLVESSLTLKKILHVIKFDLSYSFIHIIIEWLFISIKFVLFCEGIHVFIGIQFAVYCRKNGLHSSELCLIQKLSQTKYFLPILQYKKKKQHFSFCDFCHKRKPLFELTFKSCVVKRPVQFYKYMLFLYWGPSYHLHKNSVQIKVCKTSTVTKFITAATFQSHYEVDSCTL